MKFKLYCSLSQTSAHKLRPSLRFPNGTNWHPHCCCCCFFFGFFTICPILLSFPSSNLWRFPRKQLLMPLIWCIAAASFILFGNKCFAIPPSTDPRFVRGGGNIARRPNGVFISRQDGFGSCQESSWSNLKQLGFGEEALSKSAINLPINVPARKPIFTPNFKGLFEWTPWSSESLLQKDNFCQFLFFFSLSVQGCLSVCVYVSVCMMPPYRTDQIRPDTPRDRTIYKCIQRQKK